ncbi:MAG: tRNA lysidine(34) synthetase TilS [Rhodospirillales bacterium]
MSAAEFSAALDRLGPFEANPHLALAVSGGRDSLALAVLAADWVKTRGGQATALIVDHGLRLESADEARGVAAQLHVLGIAAEIRVWRGDKPVTGVAEAARGERYRLLQQWCTDHGVLHLLVAHQHDDQAETVLMRWGDGSGADGLAGMASISELASVRLLRPLLGISRARLTATLQARGLSWIDDPTNRNLSYLRPRLRQNVVPALTQSVVASAERFAHERGAIEARLAAAAVECVSVKPEGWLSIERGYFARLPHELARRLLSQAVFALAGRNYRPRQKAVRRALIAIDNAKASTVGGCRVVVRAAEILVAREAGAIAHTVEVDAGQRATLRWDGRFDLVLDGRELGGAARGRIETLGEAGRLAVLQQVRFAGPVRDFVAALPTMAARALPALWTVGRDGKTVDLLAVGDGGRLGGGPATLSSSGTGWLKAAFRPGRPLAPAAHTLVLAGQRLI